MSIEYQVGRDSSKAWIVGPAARCISFIATETAMAGVITHSLQVMPLVAPLARVGSKQLKQTLGRARFAAFQDGLAHFAGMDKMAQELAADEYALVNGHAVVAIWGALETCIEDTVVLILMNDPEAVRGASAIVKVPQTADGLLSEEEARRTFRRLENKQKLSGVMESYDWLLEQLGLTRTPKSDYSVAMKEINALRNSLMHRAGIVDQRAITEAPTLQASLGSRIKIRTEQYISYYQVVGGYVQGILGGALASRFVRYDAEPRQGVT